MREGLIDSPSDPPAATDDYLTPNRGGNAISTRAAHTG
jgi:hypothetical protein